ncbi:hypothetical protein ACQKWADRAFT_315715 [Trichoderma austrokoningii]
MSSSLFDGLPDEINALGLFYILIIQTKHNPDMYIMNPLSLSLFLSLAQWLGAGAVQNPLGKYWLIQAGSVV